MQWTQTKYETERPSMQWTQTKYETERPSMNWQQAKHLSRWSSTLVCCPECREPMTLRHFYGKHASEKHHLDRRKQCLFCFGRKQWPHGQKNRPENVNHVTACLQRFVEDAKEESEEKETVEEAEACG
ncbi:uncharacterized protein TNCV_5054001 [Trichonephila clavipes]|nr:uncharacterized protein TNCV_5054001 [Trichonephila clavipes]